MSDSRSEVPQSIQALPSAGAIAVWLSGKGVDWWAAVAGIVFIMLQIGYLLWKWRRDVIIERQRVEDSKNGQ